MIDARLMAADERRTWVCYLDGDPVDKWARAQPGQWGWVEVEGKTVFGHTPVSRKQGRVEVHNLLSGRVLRGQ